MNSFFRFLRTTLVGGILFLAPIVVVMLILGKAFALVRELLDPLVAHLRFGAILGLSAQVLVAVGSLVLICFLAGLVARTALARKTVGGFEATLVSNVPGYTFMRDLGESMLGVERKGTYPVVLARFDDAWQLGFRVEELQGGLVAVYVPGAPNPQSGSVFLMSSDRVSPADVSSAAALKCLKRVGAGSSALLKSVSVAQAPRT